VKVKSIFVLGMHLFLAEIFCCAKWMCCSI